MHWAAITKLFGILLILFSVSFVPSIATALIYHDGEVIVFVQSLLICALTGAVLLLRNLHVDAELSVREGFLVVTLFWAVFSVAGALPFMIGIHLDVTDAIFESVSAFTTTGATVIVGLDRLPPSILYHRQQMQWLGGMGMIVLAVAILPLLGVGGMQLYRAEASGVAKDEKMTPRIASTARALWAIYLTLTTACALAYWLCGMTPFDALGHAFATVATGGFSTHDASIAYYDSPAIEAVASFFMLAGGVNFAIHFLAWRQLSLTPYQHDFEARSYARIFFYSSLLVAASLYWSAEYDDPLACLRYAGFQVASILTSTGFVTANLADWPRHIPLVMILLAFVGGCAGSTAGGIKIVRIMLLFKLGLRQLYLLAHPRAVSVVKLGRRPVSGDVLFSVWAFYVLYVATSLVLCVAMMAAGLDLTSAFGAVSATINLSGPGLGEVASNFATVNDTVKWLGVFGMLAGRLEIFTLLILFLPSYWRN